MIARWVDLHDPRLQAEPDDPRQGLPRHPRPGSRLPDRLRRARGRRAFCHFLQLSDGALTSLLLAGYVRSDARDDRTCEGCGRPAVPADEDSRHVRQRVVQARNRIRSNCPWCAQRSVWYAASYARTLQIQTLVGHSSSAAAAASCSSSASPGARVCSPSTRRFISGFSPFL